MNSSSLINGKFPVGRFAAVAKIGDVEDDNSIVGYDGAMETHFFQSGIEDADGSPLVWVGLEYREFPTFASLERRLQEMGAQIIEYELDI